jgi:hypothetical protein
MPFNTFSKVMLSIIGDGDCLRRARPAIAELGSSFRFAPIQYFSTNIFFK